MTFQLPSIPMMALLVICLICAPFRSLGFKKYVPMIPNGAGIPDAPAIGHVDAAGEQGLNDFGKDFKKNGDKWTKALCQMDSDGDGFTNGQELGDPCCTWTSTSPASLITSGISHPSDKSKTPSYPELQQTCDAGTTKSGGKGAAGSAAGNISAPTSGSGGTGANTQNKDDSTPAPDDEDDAGYSAVINDSDRSRRFVVWRSIPLVVAVVLALVC